MLLKKYIPNGVIIAVLQSEKIMIKIGIIDAKQ